MTVNNPAVKILAGAVYNIDGYAVMQLKDNFSTAINISTLSDGVYLLKLQTSAGEQQLRFVKGN